MHREDASCKGEEKLTSVLLEDPEKVNTLLIWLYDMHGFYTSDGKGHNEGVTELNFLSLNHEQSAINCPEDLHGFGYVQVQVLVVVLVLLLRH